MAFSKMLVRFSSSRIKYICKSLRNNVSSLPSSLKSPSPSPSPASRLNRSSRLPVELSSMIPLHNAIASSRLVSSLSIEGKSWSLVPQGISMFL